MRHKKFWVFGLIVLLMSIVGVENMPVSAHNQQIDSWEIESNDSVASATPVNTNVYVGGSLSERSDKDCYEFYIDKPGVVQISFGHDFVDSSSNYWTVYLISSDNKDIYSGTIKGNSIQEEYGTRIGLDAGSYFVRITSGSVYSSSAEYYIRINYTADNNWEREFNETIVSANTIEVGNMVNGTITSYSDNDWYCFELPQDGSVQISFGHDFAEDSPSKFWTTEFFDGANNSIAKYTWDGKTIADSDGGKIGLPKGIYYLKCSRGEVYYSSEQYHFVINYENQNEWEREFNNTIVTANPIKVNSYIKGSNTTRSDDDWYSFEIPENGKVRISFEHGYVDSSSYYWKTSIFDDTNKSLFENKYAGNDTLKVYTNSIVLSHGTYYLKIEDATYLSDKEYCFSVEYTTTDSFDNILYDDNKKSEQKDSNTSADGDNENQKIEVINTGDLSVGQVVAVEGLLYKIADVDEVYVIGVGKDDITEIVIPIEININGNGYEVLQISKNAFKGNRKIKSVTINADLESIGANAFYNCKSMTMLQINSDVCTIGSKAFYNCKTLKTIEINTSEIESIGSKAFYKTKKTGTVIVPVEMLEYYKGLLKKAKLNSKVKVIGK